MLEASKGLVSGQRELRDVADNGYYVNFGTNILIALRFKSVLFN